MTPLAREHRPALIAMPWGLVLAWAGAATAWSASPMSRPAGPPAPEKAKPDQQAVLDAFARHTVSQKAVIDAEGNVIKLAISNHTAFWKDKTAPPPRPMPEALFRDGIRRLTHLTAVGIEKQTIGDAAYAELAGLKGLRDVRLHYMDAKAGATPDAPLFINKLPLPLEVLEIKHCFSIKGGCMGRLKPQPELRKLEIDTGYAGPEAVGFIRHCPKIENLQIHRTTMSDADIQRVFEALPQLQILLVRPAGQRNRDDRITGRSLRGLSRCPKVKMLVLGLEWDELPWEGGMDTLAKLKALRQVDFAPSDIRDFSLDAPAVRKLHEARPDMLLRFRGQSIGGAKDQQPLQEDTDWKWDGGVTTHG